MDKIIYNVPSREYLTLRYLFKKEEENYCPILRKFYYLISTSTFFERINYLEKQIIENIDFNENKLESKKIFEAIQKFKEEHFDNVMNKKISSCLLYVEKKK